jgi:hypothetical protein
MVAEDNVGGWSFAAQSAKGVARSSLHRGSRLRTATRGRQIRFAALCNPVFKPGWKLDFVSHAELDILQRNPHAARVLGLVGEEPQEPDPNPPPASPMREDSLKAFNYVVKRKASASVNTSAG